MQEFPVLKAKHLDLEGSAALDRLLVALVAETPQ